MSSNNGLTKSFDCGGTVANRTIVKQSGTDYQIIQAAAATDKLVGITTEVDSTSGERVDVILAGTADLKLGGTVAAGDPVTANASGQGVTAAPAAGVNNRIIGFAIISGVSGDIVPVHVTPGMIQG